MYHFRQSPTVNNHQFIMNSLITNKVNQMLWERKRERKKVDAYRNKRIKTKYEKIKDEQSENDHTNQAHQTPQDIRKINFYNQVFSEDPSHGTNQKTTRNTPRQPRNTTTEFQGAEPISNSHNYNSVENSNNEAENFFRRKEQQRKNKNSVGNDRKKYQNTEPNTGSEVDRMERKAGKLKNRKHKFIKKMQQRTKKGQPVMKNYIKYALTKIEQGIVKQKLDKARASLPAKPQSQKHRKFNNQSKQVK